jgi:hypothetical protein
MFSSTKPPSGAVEGIIVETPGAKNEKYGEEHIQ